MKNLFHHFASRLGARSYLLLFLLLFFSIILCYRLIQFAGDAPFDWLTGRQSATLMAAVIGAVWIILGYRIAGVNKSLRYIALSKFRETLENDDPDAEKKVRHIVCGLKIKGGMLPRLLGLIRLVPEPFLILIGIFGLACLAAYLAFYELKDACPGQEHCFLKDVLFPNAPWAILTCVLAWLVCNDIWVMDELERLLIGISIIPGSPGHLERFCQLLSPTELEIFQQAFLEKHRRKEIASDRNVSLKTVKTQINSIYNKLRQYERDNNVRNSLLKFIRPSDLRDEAPC